jgi:hypothetical protein
MALGLAWLLTLYPKRIKHYHSADLVIISAFKGQIWILIRDSPHVSKKRRPKVRRMTIEVTVGDVLKFPYGLYLMIGLIF